MSRDLGLPWEREDAVFVHRSNRTEALVGMLAQVAATPLESPFLPETVVVQSRGMERWLSQQLALRLGVWANPAFPFPRSLIDRLLAAVVPAESVPLAAPFRREALRWTLLDLLPSLHGNPDFAPVEAYLSRNRDGLEALQLATRVADLFDQYAVYRPDMIADWEAGGDSNWQAGLWRAVIARHGRHHLAARAETFFERWPTLEALPPSLPRRLHIFGIPSLPPLFLRLLSAASDRIEVHLYQLSPSREYWADTRPERDIVRLEDRTGLDAETLHLDIGHPLLASLGRTGREAQRVLEEVADYQEDPVDHHVDPGTGSALALLQSDMLHLTHRTPEGPALPVPLVPGDDSIRIHDCHGPMREVEVLHDQLTALLDADPTLAPHQILVLLPRVERYAPYVDAVFGTDPESEGHIPYRVADRSVKADSEVVDAFLRTIDVLRGRLTAPEVVDLLAFAPVRDRFELGLDDLGRIQRWIRESGIRWGRDADHRAAVGQPDHDANTWRFGLRRLLLGYAMPTGEQVLYEGILPYDDVEGEAAETLGRFAAFCDRLFALRDPLRESRSLVAWRELLDGLLTDLLHASEDNAWQHQLIRDALDALVEAEASGGHEGPVTLEGVRWLLESHFAASHTDHDFLSGGVTFCAMLPMRSIPFRVIAVLGLGDDAFPRKERAPAFDRIRQRPRPGDRSPRDEDCNLFLEAILCARERLILSWVGRHHRDNKPLSASVVLDELLAALEGSFELPPAPEGPAPPHPFVVRHPLQPFSPRYFRPDADARLFSHSRTHARGAAALLRPPEPPPPFVRHRLPLDDAEKRHVALDDLVRFFLHPQKTLLSDRLGLQLYPDEEPLAAREALVPDDLERFAIARPLLDRALRGEDLRAIWPLVRGAGRVPPGTAGECLHAQMVPEIRDLATLIRPYIQGELRDPIEVDLELLSDKHEPWRLTGWLTRVGAEHQVFHYLSRLNAAHELEAWIHHLAMCATPDLPRVTVLIGRNPYTGGPEERRYGRPARDGRPDGRALWELERLARIYWAGHQLPLPFFPGPSLAYWQTRLRKGPEEAVRSASNAWTPWRGRGPSSDPWVQRVLDGFPATPDWEPPVQGTPPFATLADWVFDGLLKSRHGTQGKRS